MAKDLESAVLTQIDATGHAPVNLAEIFLDAGTLRYAATRQSVVFPAAGNTYTAIFYTSGGRKVSRGRQIIIKDYRFDNRDGVLHGYNAAERFEGKPFIEKRVFRGALGNVAYYNEIMAGIMGAPRFDKQWMYLRVTEGKLLGQRSRNQYYQKPCNNDPGDSNCNYDGYFNLASLTATGTADSGTVGSLTDNALTQVDDYWNFGRIEITISGYTHVRKVSDFDAATDTVSWNVNLPEAVSNGDSYTIYKGCPLTWEACQGLFAYGPSADNKANFLGNLHLSKKELDSESVKKIIRGI